VTRENWGICCDATTLKLENSGAPIQVSFDNVLFLSLSVLVTRLCCYPELLPLNTAANHADSLLVSGAVFLGRQDSSWRLEDKDNQPLKQEK
jgi:hypothetical protein